MPKKNPEDRPSIHEVREGLSDLADTLLEMDNNHDEGMGSRAGIVLGMVLAAGSIIDDVMDLLERGIEHEEREDNKKN